MNTVLRLLRDYRAEKAILTLLMERHDVSICGVERFRSQLERTVRAKERLIEAVRMQR